VKTLTVLLALLAWIAPSSAALASTHGGASVRDGTYTVISVAVPGPTHGHVVFELQEGVDGIRLSLRDGKFRLRGSSVGAYLAVGPDLGPVKVRAKGKGSFDTSPTDLTFTPSDRGASVRLAGEGTINELDGSTTTVDATTRASVEGVVPAALDEAQLLLELPDMTLRLGRGPYPPLPCGGTIGIAAVEAATDPGGAEAFDQYFTVDVVVATADNRHALYADVPKPEYVMELQGGRGVASCSGDEWTVTGPGTDQIGCPFETDPGIPSEVRTALGLEECLPL